MKRNNFFSRFIVVTLTAALLFVSESRAIRVSALADEAIQIAPVFDTQIINLSDYVSENLTDQQLDIFYLLGGALVASQYAAQGAQLQTPYQTESNIKEWLINCGIQLYNSLIVLVPSGDYYVSQYPASAQLGVKREDLKPLVAMLMGNAVFAKNYGSIDDLPQNYTLPFNKDIQLGINALYGLYGGYYQWQVSSQPFRSPWEWNMYSGMSNLDIGQYNSIVNTFQSPCVRIYSTDSPWNIQVSCEFFRIYKNIFINTTNNTVHLVDALGNDAPTGLFYGDWVGYYQGSMGVTTYTNTSCGRFTGYKYYTAANYNNYQEVVNAVFSQNINLFDESRYFFQDFVVACYAGTSWNDKVLVQNLTDLDFQINNTPYYEQVQTEILIDIRDFIGDLIDTIDIPFDNSDTTLVSIDLTPITNLLAPPIPVDMNEIAELTDNLYLERVKEEAERGGNALAYLVAFWHNCDAELIYVLFGAGITVLVGAFIGKWGHS